MNIDLSKILDTDLFAATLPGSPNETYKVTGADFKTLVSAPVTPPPPPPMPWDGHNGGIWHIKNVTGSSLILYIPSFRYKYTAWDIDGTNERQIDKINIGEELVFVSEPDSQQLFKNQPTGNWEFGEFTNTSNVTNMNKMFDSSFEFNADLGDWDTSSVTDMERMFYQALEFNGDVRGWDTSSVTTMKYMFFRAEVFNQDIGGWNTKNVTDMVGMLQYAYVFVQDLSQWCVSQLPTRPSAFASSSALDNEKDKLPQWGTCPRGEDQVQSVASNSNVEASYFAVQSGATVYKCKGSDLKDRLKDGDSLLVNRGGQTFNWTVKDFNLPWEDESKTSWHITNLSKVASPDYDDLSHLYVMLAHATQMEVYQLDGPNPTKNLADITNANDPDSLIYKADGAAVGEEEAIEELIAEIQAIEPDYPDFIPLVRIPTGGEYVIVHEQNNPVVNGQQLSEHPLFLSDNMSWDFGNLTRTGLVTNIQYLLHGAYEFTGDVGYLNLENVTSIYLMFSDKFNHPSIGSWNTSNVVRIGNLFESNRIFNQDITGWDMRRVTDVVGMFNGAWAFNQDIGDWQFEDIVYGSDTGEHPFSMMLINAKAFNQDISRWCVENVPIGPNGGILMWMQGANPDFVSNTSFHPKWGQPCP
jgi:surface protein